MSARDPQPFTGLIDESAFILCRDRNPFATKQLCACGAGTARSCAMDRPFTPAPVVGPTPAEVDVQAIARVLDEHAGCVANGQLGTAGSGDTGIDVWTCGIEVPYVDNLDTMARLHLATALEPLLAAARREGR